MGDADIVDDAQRRMLQAYDHHMTSVLTSDVAKGGIRHHAKTEWDAASGTLKTQADVDESALIAFLVLFRPLWMQGSPQNFFVVSSSTTRSFLSRKQPRP